MILAFVYVLIMNKKRKEAQLAKEVCIIMNKISHWAFWRSSEHYPKEHTCLQSYISATITKGDAAVP